MGHAKVLAGVTDLAEQARLAQLVVDQGAQRAEPGADRERRPASPQHPHLPKRPRPIPPTLRILEKTLSRQLGMRVQVRAGKKKGRGRLILHYGSLDQFDDLMSKLGVATDEQMNVPRGTFICSDLIHYWTVTSPRVTAFSRRMPRVGASTPVAREHRSSLATQRAPPTTTMCHVAHCNSSNISDNTCPWPAPLLPPHPYLQCRPMSQPTADPVDLAIIGAGPTGLFAAFYAGLRQMSVKLIDSLEILGGQLTTLYPEKYIYDVAGFPKVLAKDLVQGPGRAGPPVRPDRLPRRAGPGPRLRRRRRSSTRSARRRATHLARSVILAAGVGAFQPKTLPLPNAKQYEGRGLHYFVKSVAEFEGKTRPDRRRGGQRRRLGQHARPGRRRR